MRHTQTVHPRRHSPWGLAKAGLAVTLLLHLAACGGGTEEAQSTASAATAPGGTDLARTQSASVDVNSSHVIDVSRVPRGNTRSGLPERWFAKGAFMEINVRAYNDSDGDGVGDLNGVTQKLDYLKDLGITGIWLMPIMKTDDHDSGYIVSDHRNLEIEYGNREDFRRLIREAHKRGIGILMDYVVNHSASANPLFLDSASSPGARYRNWYVWQSEHPDGWRTWSGSDPWFRSQAGDYYYASFGEPMPEFNLRNPEVVAYHEDTLRYWLNLGVDGFRFDAVDNLFENGPTGMYMQPENLDLIRKLRHVVDEYENRYVVCESPGQAAFAASEMGCKSSFAFGTQALLRNLARGDTSELGTLEDVIRNYKPAARMALFLGNHDHFAGDRLMNELGDDTSYRLAATAMLTLPGIPFVYYGEEVGMQSMVREGNINRYEDRAQRGPMSWSTQPSVTDNTRIGYFANDNYYRPAPNVATHNVERASGDPQSIWSFYKHLLHLRQSSSALSDGDFNVVAKGQGSIAYERRSATESVVVVINFGKQEEALSLSSLPAGITYTTKLAYGDGPRTPMLASDANVSPISITSPARSIQIFRASFSDREIYDRSIYLRGEMNNWAAPDTQRFVYRGRSRYELPVDLEGGRTYQFKISTSDWGRYNFGAVVARSGERIDVSDGGQHELELVGWAYPADTNIGITVAHSGKYLFALDVRSPLAPRIRVKPLPNAENQ
jgi:glycosidase